MKILGIDSSAAAASAAVVCDGKVTSQVFANVGLTHSQTLMPMVKSALDSAGVDINDIDLFAVTNGPGSFTGVRIGVAAVKGMAQPLNKSCIGISSLEAIAKPFECSGALIVSAMDARCSQVYTASFDGETGSLKRLTADEAITVDELSSRLKVCKRRVILAGDGAAICYEKMKDIVPDIYIAGAGVRYQCAASVAVIACERFSSDCSDAVSAAELLPQYLRLPQAERELKSKLKA